MHFRHILMIALCCAVAHAQTTSTVPTVGSTSTVPTVGSTSTVPTVGTNVPISSPSLQSASASMMSASLADTVPSVAGSLSTAAPSLSDVLPASTLSESSSPDSFPASVSQSSIVSESSSPIPAPPVSEGMQEARIVTSLSSSARNFLRPAVIPPPPQQTAAQAAAAETDTDPQVIQLKNQLQVTIDNIATKKKEIEEEKAKIEQDTQNIREQNSNAERLKLLIVKQQKTAIKQKLETKLHTIIAQLDAVKQQAHGVLGQKSALEETKAQIEQQIGRYV